VSKVDYKISTKLFAVDGSIKEILPENTSSAFFNNWGMIAPYQWLASCELPPFLNTSSEED